MSLIVKANQFLHHGHVKQAEQLYRQLLRQNPNDIDALWGLGKVGLTLDSYQGSYDIFSRCVELVSTVPQLWLSLAQACEKLRRFKELEKALLQAYKIKHDYVPTLLALATFYCQSNQLENANNYLNKILKIVPEHPQAFALKVRIKSQTTINKYASNLLEKLSQPKCVFSENEQILLHYAFADLFQGLGNVEQAYKHFQQANFKQKNTINFTVADMKSYFTSLIETFSSELLDSSLNSKQSKTINLTPIFIVGQPRSGSTLLESMLSAHSEISTAGELPFLAGDIAQGIEQITGQNFPEGCNHLSHDQCQTLGQHYLSHMKTIAPNAKYIIDKMPANYQSIGLIKMLLPHAKIIHISRSVKDVTWSIFSNYFEANEPYFCSIDEIINYSKNYHEVMAHWHKVLPNFVHDLSYESLVNNPEEVLSKVLAFCGLSFQTACLNFSDRKGYIATLSDVQLRSGIKTNQNKAWQAYEELLPENFRQLT